MYENTTELTHYGVKGMRWGHRKASYYDKRVAANLKRASTAKSGYAQARAKNRAEINKYYADRARRIAKSKNLYERIMVDNSHEDAVKSMKAYSNIERNNAKASKTKLMRQVHKVNAMNNDEGIKYRENIHKAKGIKNKAKAAIVGFANIKTANITGRQTTLGESIIESMIPGMGLLRDYEYLRDHKGQFGKL